MRLVLIDNRINEIDNIIDSLTPDTEYKVFDHENDTIPNIQNRIVKNYESVAIIQHNYNFPYYKLVNNCANSTLTDLATEDPELDSWSEYIAFLVWLKTERGVEFVDLLACNLWADDNWKYMIETVRNREGVHIRASLNITGAGGDFILESDGVDMVGIYFTEDILDYKYVFLASGHTTQYLQFNFTQRFTSGSNGERFLIGRIFFFASADNINTIYTGTSVEASSSTTASVGSGQYSVLGCVLDENKYTTSSSVPAYNNPNPSVGGPEWILGSTSTTINITVVINLGSAKPIYGYVFFVNANSNYWGYGSTPKTWTVSKGNSSTGTWSQIDSKTMTTYPTTINAVNFWTHPISSENTYYTPFEVIVTVPGQPTITSIVGGNNQLTVNFTAPASNGGSTITAYLYSINNSATYTQINTVTTSPFVISTGISNGNTYNVKIIARNTAGDSIASTNVTGTPFTVPGAPAITSIVGGNNQLTVYFTAPASNGGSTITAYLYSINDSATYIQINPATTSPFVISTGISNGTAYNVKIIARNLVGDSIASTNVSGTPRTVPGQPVIGTIVGGNNTLTVNFTAPASNGGSAITAYLYSINDSATYTQINTVTTSPFVISTGVSNGTAYNVKIIARNAAGDSIASPNVSGTPVSVPSAPIITSMVGGNNTITVSFSTPASNGSPITAYLYSLNDSATYIQINTVTTSPFTISTDVFNGNTYTVKIIARNAAGDSLSSNISTVYLYTTPFPVSFDTGNTLTIASGNLQVVMIDTSNTAINSVYYWYSIDGGTVYSNTNIKNNGSAYSPYVFYIPGLSNQSYTVSVYGNNSAGSSTISSITKTVYITPSPPVIDILNTSSQTSGNLTVTFDDTINTSLNGDISYYYYIVYDN